jgi:predicted dehydrogenase
MSIAGTLVGCGFFAQNHLHAWHDLEGVDIVAVCDIDSDKAEATARRYGIPRYYVDVDEMLARERPGFIDIVTTVGSHRHLVEVAAARGVPAICQKPFAESLEDASAMVNACADAGIPLMVHENFRWQRPILEASKTLSSGKIGMPFFGRVSFRHDFDVYQNQPYLAEVERFAILDVGIHLLDVARFLFGEVTRLSCTTQSVNPSVRGEDVATILLEHAGGTTTIVDCSFFSHIRPNPFPDTLLEIDATEGSVRLSQGGRLFTVANDKVSERDVYPPIACWMTPPWHTVQDSVLNIQAHWLECLRRGAEPDTSGADNMKTLTLGFAAYRAASGRTVELVDLRC